MGQGASFRLRGGEVGGVRLASYADRTVYQTDEYLRFVQESQGATPVRAEFVDDGEVVGGLTGLIVTRLGVRVFGSPLPGWSAAYLGFNVRSGYPRWRLLEALPRFAYRQLKCLHVELVDPLLTPEDGDRASVRVGHLQPTWESNLELFEDEIFARMESSCRRAIRKAQKSGVTVEEVDPRSTDAVAFVAEYYEQVLGIFGKQGLAPPYPLERVEKLVEHLGPAGLVLLLRARDSEGRCIGTNISVGLNRRAEFWGSGALPDALQMRPNNAMHWHAMRAWKKRGVAVYDWGGGGTYKGRYGGELVEKPRFVTSRVPGVMPLRKAVRQAFRLRQRVAGMMSQGASAMIAALIPLYASVAPDLQTIAVTLPS